MWTYLKWTFRIVILLIVGLFLHYELPRHDIVRITNTYNRLTTIGSNAIFYSSGDSGSAETGATRDIRFIEAVQPNGKVVVYRNEDTGWVWPPYFKYNSSNVQAEATNLRSDAANPQWVRVTKYGWRIPFISIYPNAVRLRPVEGPDVTIIPWVNIVILTLLALAVIFVRRMWLQFWERTVDPALGQAEIAGKRARGWFGGLFGPRPPAP